MLTAVSMNRKKLTGMTRELTNMMSKLILCRMDMQHHAIQLVLKNELFLAPLQDPKCILDHGTGTGESTTKADNYPY
jgi:hypothetical protein